MKTTAPPRAKNMMYEQQIKHLPSGITGDDLFDLIGSKLNPRRYAIALHDSDMSEDGTPAEAHLHVMLCFENAHSIASVAKTLGDKPEYIAKWDDRADNGFAYLCHRTENSQGKFQYDPSSVEANFDYLGFLARYEVAARKAKKNIRINELLDALKNGSITLAEVEAQLPGSLYGRYEPQLQRVNQLRLRREATAWRKNAMAEGKTISLIWIYGGAGTGKTRLAKELASRKGDPYFITGSQRDIFQQYEGQHTIILDEFRPGVMEYADFLRLTDTYAIVDEVMAPARYKDKAIACDLYIVTSPYSPYQFYHNLGVNGLDSFDQLERRILLTIQMTRDFVMQVASTAQGSQRIYSPLPGKCFPNRWSSPRSVCGQAAATTIFLDTISNKEADNNGQESSSESPDTQTT